MEKLKFTTIIRYTSAYNSSKTKRKVVPPVPGMHSSFFVMLTSLKN